MDFNEFLQIFERLKQLMRISRIFHCSLMVLCSNEVNICSHSSKFEWTLATLEQNYARFLLVSLTLGQESVKSRGNISNFSNTSPNFWMTFENSRNITLDSWGSFKIKENNLFKLTEGCMRILTPLKKISFSFIEVSG